MTKFYLKIFLCFFIINGDNAENKDEEIEVQRELNLTFYDEIFQEQISEMNGKIEEKSMMMSKNMADITEIQNQRLVITLKNKYV